MAKTKRKTETLPPNKLDAALAFAEKGWPIFAVRFDKKPYTANGVLDATTDPKRIEAMWAKHPRANIALNVGEAGMMVVDDDPGYDEKELVERVGPIPETKLWARTPRGGRHRYFEIGDKEIVANSSSKLAPHVDVRSFHGYVLLPPSRTKDGEYTWGSQGKPLFRTDEMLRLANSGRERHRDHDTWIIEQDLPENVEECIRWLQGKGTHPCRIAIDGQGGDQTAYNTAAMCKSFGISQEMAFDLMWDHWNPRCIPPWTADDIDHLETKVENGYRYNTSPPGNVTPAYKTAKSAELFKAKPRPRLVWAEGECIDYEDWSWPDGNEKQKPLTKKEHAKTRREFAELNRKQEQKREKALFESMQAALGFDGGSIPTIPLYDLDQLASLPAPEWDMEGLIGRGKMGMIVGKWGQYKTFVALDMSVALAGGVPWSAIAEKGCKQYAVPVPRRVLYIAAEGGAAEYRQRLEAALQNRKEIDRDKVTRNFVIATASAPLDTTIGQRAIADMIERATKQLGGAPEVIFCDTLAKSMVGEENSNTDMGKVQCVAAAIQRALDCTFIFVHHTGKDGEKSGRGASSMPAGLDFMLHVTGDEETLVATVNVEKQKDAKPEKGIILQGRVVGNSLAFARITKAPSKKGDQETAVMRDIHTRYILAALRGHRGKTWTLKDLATEARMKGCTLQHATLRIDVLGIRNGQPGWARSHPALSPYFNPHSEKWVSPQKHPHLDPKFDLEDEE